MLCCFLATKVWSLKYKCEIARPMSLAQDEKFMNLRSDFFVRKMSLLKVWAQLQKTPVT